MHATPSCGFLPGTARHKQPGPSGAQREERAQLPLPIPLEDQRLRLPGGPGRGWWPQREKGNEGRRRLPHGHVKLGAAARVMGVDGHQNRRESQSSNVTGGPQPKYWAWQRKNSQRTWPATTGRLEAPSPQQSKLLSSTTNETFISSWGTVNYSWRKHAENIYLRSHLDSP